MLTHVTRVTERGQASIPAAVRKRLGLRTGARLVWEPVSDREVRVFIEATPAAEGPRSVLGYARQFRATRPTAAWMKELREGERD